MINNLDKILNTGNNTSFLEKEIMRIKNIGKNNSPMAKTIRQFDSINSMWINMPFSERDMMRQKFPDSDGDRTPDIFDCKPFDVMRQDRVTNEAFGRINQNFEKRKQQGFFKEWRGI